MELQLELISKALRESFTHANTTNTGEPVFTKEQMEVLSESIKYAFAEYQRQINEGK